MRVSVIPTDKIIIIDGTGIELEDWNFDDKHIHAIQWMHDKGHIELKTTEPNIEINDISFVQPYIDAYKNTLPSIKEKALLAKEEERLRREQQEEEKRKHLEEVEREREQVNKLIEQNKKIREEKLRLEAEKSSLIEEIDNTKRHYDIELERKELEKQAELQAAKHNATMRELIDKDTNILSNYENLKAQLEKEIAASKLEQEKFEELIQTHQKNIDLEREKLEEKKVLLQKEIDFERKKLEDQFLLTQEVFQNEKLQLEYEKDAIGLMRDELNIDNKQVVEKRKLLEQEYEAAAKMLQFEQFELDQKIEDFMSQRKEFEELSEQKPSNSEELNIFKEEQQDIIESSIKNIESINENIQKEVISNLEYEDVSIEELLNIMNDLDPEQVYTSLTSGEIDENNFPVEKAIVWFSALKKAMDKK